MAIVLAMYGTREAREKTQSADLAAACLGRMWMTWPRARKDAMTCDTAWVSKVCTKGSSVATILNVAVAVTVRQDEFRA